MISQQEHYQRLLGSTEGWKIIDVNMDSMRVLISIEYDPFNELSGTQKKSVQVIAMDLWRSFINVAGKYLPEAAIAHDGFHVSKNFNEAIDKVRKQQHKKLMQAKDKRLKCSKYLWLKGLEI